MCIILLLLYNTTEIDLKLKKCPVNDSGFEFYDVLSKTAG